MAVLERAGYSPQQRMDARRRRMCAFRAGSRGRGRVVVDLHWRALRATSNSARDDLIWARMQRVSPAASGG